MAAAAALPLGPIRLRAQAGTFASQHGPMLADVAAAVLPESIGRRGAEQAADAFLGWIRNYRPGVAMDNGYGITRQHTTPPLPLAQYAAQMDALAQAARARGAAFGALSVADRRTLVESALRAAHIDQLPNRPAGVHVAADLMAHYFRSAEATDLCYRAEIRRFECRGLADSTAAPERLKDAANPRLD
jgi:hypothetical protein